MNRLISIKRIIAAIAASAMLITALGSCTKKEVSPSLQKEQEINDKNGNKVPEDINGASENISMPEGQDKTEEVITNHDYADSELYDFTGTVDEIYEDGSILVYSPEFRVNFNYRVIVEFDENSVIDGFELAENQHIKFEVYSEFKKSNPLTVVAAKLTLLNEVSTQREEEAERIAQQEEQIKNLNLK